MLLSYMTVTNLCMQTKHSTSQDQLKPRISKTLCLLLFGAPQ